MKKAKEYLKRLKMANKGLVLLIMIGMNSIQKPNNSAKRIRLGLL